MEDFEKFCDELLLAASSDLVEIQKVANRDRQQGKIVRQILQLHHVMQTEINIRFFNRTSKDQLSVIMFRKIDEYKLKYLGR